MTDGKSAVGADLSNRRHNAVITVGFGAIERDGPTTERGRCFGPDCDATKSHHQFGTLKSCEMESLLQVKSFRAIARLLPDFKVNERSFSDRRQSCQSSPNEIVLNADDPTVGRAELGRFSRT
jgi:hypothetical protein